MLIDPFQVWYWVRFRRSRQALPTNSRDRVISHGSSAIIWDCWLT